MIKSKLFDKSNGKSLDYPMLLVIGILICCGLVILASASSYAALNTYSDSNYFLFRQLGWAILGIIVMLIISKIDYNIYKRLAYLGFAVALLLMIAVLIPGIGVNVKGAQRWLGVGIFRFQPSEIMKIMLVIAVSSYIVLNFKKIRNIFGYMPAIGMLVAVCIVMYFQNHLSGTVIMIAGSLSVIYASGIKLNFKLVVGGILLVLIAGGIFVLSDSIKFENGKLLFQESFRTKRIVAFMNPEEDLKGDNWQAAQSLYAIGTGGVFGLGLRTE
ncbi:MAG: FtsW/RodA/SpoVE family cell cycle protein [Clostridia bacterium]